MNFLRMPELRKKLGNPCKSTVGNRIRDGLLPRPIKDGPISIWLDEEIEAIQAYRIAGRTDEEIRRLVQRLIACRPDRAHQVAA